MINEKIEVEGYLDGQNIYKNECTFRMCYLMARYYNEQGFSPLEVRKKIFDWGRKYGIYIVHNVNDIIKIAATKNEPLCTTDVYVNQNDIKEIEDRFSRKNAKLCALAILLLTKAYGDENGIVTFSQIDFAKWVGILQPNVSTIFDELEFLDYVERVRLDEESIFVWNGRVMNKNVKYRLKVPYINEGDFVLKDNQIRELYDEIFSSKS